MKKIITIGMMIGVIMLSSCKEEVKERVEIANPLFKTGEEVKFKASNFGKKGIVLAIDTMDKKSIVYVVSYFTIWDTRRVKRISELEIEKIK